MIDRSGPSGEAIGPKVDVPPGPLEPAIRETLRCIDRVHGAMGLPRLSVVWIGEDSPRGRYRPAGNGQAASIEMSERGPTPRLTFAHEVGHYLDHFWGGFERYASATIGSPLAEVIAAVKKSEAYARLQREGEDTHEAFFIRHNITAYLMSSEELWARAYSQYIGLLSRDPEIAVEAAGVRKQSDYNRFTLWTDEDFEPIVEAIERCLRKMRWRQ